MVENLVLFAAAKVRLNSRLFVARGRLGPADRCCFGVRVQIRDGLGPLEVLL